MSSPLTQRPVSARILHALLFELPLQARRDAAGLESGHGVFGAVSW